MDKTQTKYERRGVSASKSEVHRAIKNLDKGLYPNAFCKILPDVISNDPNKVAVMHCDTAGTKPSLAYLYWKETGDNTVWKNIAQDALIMNLDDMACVGILDQFIISSNIARNKNLIPGEVLTHIIEGTQQLINEFQEHNIQIHHAGGETADVGDIVRTLDVGFTAIASIPKEDLIVNNVQPGNVIVGLSSSGQCSYEKEYNSGIGSNGLTSARHDLLHKKYKDLYPETFDPSIPSDLVYSGSYNVNDIEPQTNVQIGKLLLSPTRSYVPILKEVISQYKSEINGIIHCTGGGLTKVMKFVENIHVIKDNLMDIPPLFHIIHKESNTPLREMYQTFNMGQRLEIYTSEKIAQEIITIAKNYNIDAQIIGYCEAYTGQKLTIKHKDQEFVY